MKHFNIGLQLFSVRSDLSRDFFGTLQKVKAMGYDGVEFAGLYGHTPEEIKNLCQELELTPISAHVPFLEMIEKPEETMAAYAKIGCRYVVIPYLTQEYRPNGDKFHMLLEGAKTLGLAAQKHGLTLLYHNHDFEFVRIDGEYALDILYSTVPASLLQTEIDTCWANVGGVNPAEYVRKYTGRAPIVHLKDFAGKAEGKMYALIGLDDTEDQSQTEGAFQFRPVGYGLQNFPAILSAAEDAGADWVIVEQDEPSMNKTPLECASLSISYLKTLI